MDESNRDDSEKPISLVRPKEASVRKYSTLRVPLPPESNYEELSSETKRKLSEKEIVDIWSADIDVAPQAMASVIFNLRPDSKPRIISRDKDFERNTDIAIKFLGGVHEKYFIVDCGIAHLFAVALSLRRCGVSVSFYIPDSEALRFQESLHIKDIRTKTDSLLYYADDYKEAKNSTPLINDSLATMIDFHRAGGPPRTYHLTEEAFPSSETIKRVGIKEVVVLGEAYETAEGIIRAEEHDLFGVLDKYKSEGLNVKVVRIDSHKGDSFSFMQILK